MLERYGEDVTQHPVGDVELWERTQGGNKFGISSSDSNFIITGAPSSSSGSTPTYAEYQRSQEKVRDLQSQVEELHNRVEDVQQKMRDEVQHHMREEIQQQMREEMKEEMQRQIAELMKKFGFDVYLVGGRVRDLILKRTPKDFDVLTTAELKEASEKGCNGSIRRILLIADDHITNKFTR
ncbi:hypothetical protein E3N88_45564 [Mikania micrantha]|uniref:Poly A polymerase head domain-containing protein n=1 Tax=Mikania micrantha TaxID=192012 RepID=A0A5N6LB27_9ASTR|nr:hypothetical protein E3N88_45564 [Mikania micrantha]